MSGGAVEATLGLCLGKRSADRRRCAAPCFCGSPSAFTLVVCAVCAVLCSLLGAYLYIGAYTWWVTHGVRSELLLRVPFAAKRAIWEGCAPALVTAALASVAAIAAASATLQLYRASSNDPPNQMLGTYELLQANGDDGEAGEGSRAHHGRAALVAAADDDTAPRGDDAVANVADAEARLRLSKRGTAALASYALGMSLLVIQWRSLLERSVRVRRALGNEHVSDLNFGLALLALGSAASAVAAVATAFLRVPALRIVEISKVSLTTCTPTVLCGIAVVLFSLGADGVTADMAILPLCAASISVLVVEVVSVPFRRIALALRSIVVVMAVQSFLAVFFEISSATLSPLVTISRMINVIAGVFLMARVRYLVEHAEVDAGDDEWLEGDQVLGGWSLASARGLIMAMAQMTVVFSFGAALSVYEDVIAVLGVNERHVWVVQVQGVGALVLAQLCLYWCFLSAWPATPYFFASAFTLLSNGIPGVVERSIHLLLYGRYYELLRQEAHAAQSRVLLQAVALVTLVAVIGVSGGCAVLVDTIRQEQQMQRVPKWLRYVVITSISGLWFAGASLGPAHVISGSEAGTLALAIANLTQVGASVLVLAVLTAAALMSESVTLRYATMMISAPAAYETLRMAVFPLGTGLDELTQGSTVTSLALAGAACAQASFCWILLRSLRAPLREDTQRPRSLAHADSPTEL